MKRRLKAKTVCEMVSSMHCGRWWLRASMMMALAGYGLPTTAALFDAWGYRMTVTFDQEIDETLSDFPVLVELGEHLAGFEYAQFRANDGADLRFAAMDEETELAYEIERWNTNGVSTVWLRMPQLQGTGEVVNVYWGFRDATVPLSNTNGTVWANSYRGVWHLAETNVLAGQTGGIHDDSTTHAVTGSQFYNCSSNGVAGGGQYFNGHTAYIDFGNPDPVQITEDLTLSVWVKPEVLAGERGLLSKWSGSWCWALQDGVNRLYFNTWRVASIAIGIDEWSCVAAVYDATASQFRLYVNGQLRGTHAQTSGPGTAANLFLGHRGAGGPNHFQGWMDEARIAATARSSAWMDASYLTVASNDWFTTYAAAMPQATNLAVVIRPVSDRGDTYATLNGVVMHTGDAENPHVYVCWGVIDGLTHAPTNWAHVVDVGTNWGAGETFSTAIAGLNSGSSYVYRAYATNTTGEAWSDARTFTTASLPAIADVGPAWARRREVRLEGELLDAGFQSPTVWVDYWPAGGAITSSVAIGTFNEQSFDVLLENLAPATTYQYQFAASNTAGVARSVPGGFTTLTGDPIGWYAAANGLSGTGIDWNNAFNDLQSALSVAEAGDTIYMAGQLFPLSAEISWTTSGVTIEGGYEGVGLPGNRDVEVWPTVLTRGNPALPHRLMFISGVADGVLSGLVFSNGYARADAAPVRPAGDGGGLYITGCSNLTIDQCVVRNNAAYHHMVNGGDIYGGGLYIANSTVSILNTLIHANRVTTRSSANLQHANGGGLASIGGAVLVSNCCLSGNFVAADYMHGYVRGGGAYVNGTATFSRTVFKDNDVGTPSKNNNQLGDGVAVMGGNARLENCLIAYNGTNKASVSGTQNIGLYAGGGVTTVRGCTIVSNNQYGVFRGGGGTVNIHDSILWAHTRDIHETVAGGISLAHSSSQQGYNLGADGCVDDDPRFIDWTWFHLESPSGQYTGGYFDGGAWESGTLYSALIDAGDPARPFANEPTPGGARLNMGAYGNTAVASRSRPLAVANHPASGLGPNQATLNGELLHLGDPDVEIRVYWGTSNGETNTNAWDSSESVGTLTVRGTFAVPISGLSVGVTHWYAVRAVNSAGTVAWAQPSLSFTPQIAPPEIIMTGVENDETSLVTLKGEVTVTGGDAPQVYICWGASHGDSTNTNTWEHVDLIGPQSGSFTHNVTVTPGSNYFYTVYAVNAAGTVWGSSPLPFGLYRMRYVDSAATGSATGYNWPHAFTSLQAALDDTINSRTNFIHVREGDYIVATPVTWTGAHVRVLGGYAGDGGPGTRDPVQWPTVVSNLAGTIRVFLIEGAVDAVLEGVTVAGGNMAGAGGGLLITASQDVTIRDCRITGNRAVGNGGGIAVEQGTNVKIEACQVSENDATDAGGVRYGGGLYISGGSGVVSNCVVERNRARNGTQNYGAGIYFNGGAWTVRDSAVRYNTCSGAYPRGGVVLTGSGNTTFRNCLIAQNHSIGYDGLWHINGTALLENCTIAGNNGQGVVGISGTTIRNSVLWNNTVDITGAVNLSHNNIEDATALGVNSNISVNPRFEYGVYLASDSPCIGIGDRSVADATLTGYTTRAAGTPAAGGAIVDLGYHASAGMLPALANRYVATGGNDANGGTAWGDAFATITRALADAVEGSRIHVAAGAYANGTETFPLVIDKLGIQLLGDDVATTILDASGSGQRVLTVNDDSFGVISNLTLRGGDNSTDPTGYGAGMYIWNANQLALSKLVVSNNIAGHHGGGVSIWHSQAVDIRDSVFAANIIDIWARDQVCLGGGLHAVSCSGTLSACVISNNRTRNTRHYSSNTQSQGGGLALDDGQWLVQRCMIEANQVIRFASDYKALYGGGVEIVSGTHEFRSCLIATNRVIRPNAQYGHGVSVHNGALTLLNCTVVDNAGEGLHRVAGTVAITNAIFWNNGVDYANPALDGEGSDPNVAWSNFADGLNNGVNNCISADPQFVDHEGQDYRLCPRWSPCVDVGRNLPWMLDAHDLQGWVRIKYGARSVTVDMGAYETQPIPGTLLLLR